MEFAVLQPRFCDLRREWAEMLFLLTAAIHGLTANIREHSAQAVRAERLHVRARCGANFANFRAIRFACG